MALKTILFLLLCASLSVYAADPEIEEEELKARVFLQHLSSIVLNNDNKVAVADWNYETNITEHNKQIFLEVETKNAVERKEQWQQIIKYNWHNFKDKDLKRQFKLLSILGPAALPEQKYKKLTKIISDMSEIYSTAKICSYHNSTKCDLPLSPDLEDIMASSSDPEELKHVWKEWRNVVGPKVKHLYKEYVELQNEGVRLNNLSDTGEYWLSDYDTPDIKEQIENIWQQLRPLYLQIHAYVRYQLNKKYGDVVSKHGPIPAHMLGNMWAQTWEHIYDSTKPYSHKKETSVSDEMVKQGYDHLKIFKTSEDFFVSLNMSAMTKDFWENSMLVKPTDREVVCHASAHEFYNGKDFRIKQCTRITEEELLIAHHEMGHIQYFMQYSNQPFVYRSGANEGFHEAIGDVIALSVQTNDHMKKIGLIKNDTEDDYESEINSLYSVGLGKIVFLPFAYIMDLWRWDVFSGKTTSHDYNCKWWKLVEDYQGIEPVIDRTEKDFDPASKFHIVADVPYLRYFVSFIIQFQFHKSLCIKAGQYDPQNPIKPLHKCDIYQSVEAGNVFREMLQLGSSLPWQDAMERVTGQRNMDASGILDYFKPLQSWLEAENKKNGISVGWQPSEKQCVKSKKSLKHQ